MPYEVYSVEPLPRQGRGDAREYIFYNGFLVGPVPGRTWWNLKKVYSTIVHRDFEDKQGTAKTAIDDEIAAFINAQWAYRGVVAVSTDELATSADRRKLEEECERANRIHREGVVREFEHQLEAWKLGQPGRAKPSPYEEECYDILGWPKPNSVESLRASRMPGEAAAERMMEAFMQMTQRMAAAPAPAAVATTVIEAEAKPEEEKSGRTPTQNRSHKAS